MVDIKTVLDNDSLREQYLYKLKKLEAKKRRVERQLEELENSCAHDILLSFGDEEDTYSICICCKKNFKDKINPYNAIYITDYLEEGLEKEIIFSKTMIKQLVNRAQEKLISILALDSEIPFLALKEEIKNDLLAFMIKEEDFKITRK